MADSAKSKTGVNIKLNLINTDYMESSWKTFCLPGHAPILYTALELFGSKVLFVPSSGGPA